METSDAYRSIEYPPLQVGRVTRPAYMKQEEKHKDFAESLREWAEWNRKGAEAAKLHFMTGFRM